jgi:hypothetical protein
MLTRRDVMVGAVSLAAGARADRRRQGPQTWYVDRLNWTERASDGNDGLSAERPLRTKRVLVERLQFVDRPTVVTWLSEPFDLADHEVFCHWLRSVKILERGSLHFDHRSRLAAERARYGRTLRNELFAADLVPCRRI